MPVHSCQENGKPGYQWGSKGKCYTYTPGNDASRKRAKAKAEAQGRAARASGYQGSFDNLLESLDNIAKSLNVLMSRIKGLL